MFNGVFATSACCLSPAALHSSLRALTIGFNALMVFVIFKLCLFSLAFKNALPCRLATTQFALCKLLAVLLHSRHSHAINYFSNMYLLMLRHHISTTFNQIYVLSINGLMLITNHCKLSTIELGIDFVSCL